MIAVITLQFGDLPYFPVSARINQAYCKKHGYPWLVAPALEETHRHAVWAKVKRIHEVLTKVDCEFVLFLDADAWFCDHAKTIETLIADHMAPPAVLLMGQDRRDKDFAWNVDHGNTGVILVRNTPIAAHILLEWWHVAEYDVDSRWTWPPEQLAFNRHILPRWKLDGHAKLVPHPIMNGRDGEFIRHAINCSNQERLEILQAESLRLGLG